jgi:hypothetical protein
MTDLQARIAQKINEAYEIASIASDTRNMAVSFEIDGVTFTVKPHRLGRKIFELEQRIRELVGICEGARQRANVAAHTIRMADAVATPYSEFENTVAAGLEAINDVLSLLLPAQQKEE